MPIYIFIFLIYVFFPNSVEYLLRPRGLYHVHPLSRVVQLGLELSSKVGVGEARRVVLLHEVDDRGRWGALPPPPEPLTVVGGHGVHPPVEEDAQLGVVVPGGQGAGVEGRPGGQVPT